MGSIINIPSGTSVIGNSTTTVVAVSDAMSINANIVKTLVNGQWKSWVKGADGFQGFNNIEPGMGYVVTALNSFDLELPGEDVNINNVNIPNKISLLAFPYDNKKVSGIVIPRLKPKTLRTMENGVWKSWDKNASEAFQGFSTLDRTKGYVVNPDKVYTTYLHKDFKSNDTGVTIGTEDTSSIIDIFNVIPKIKGLGVEYKVTSINNAGSLANPGIVTTGYYQVDGIVFMLTFPAELINTKITVRKSDIEIVDYGALGENTIIEDLNVLDGYEDYGYLNATQYLTTHDFVFTLSENNTSETAFQPESIVDETILEIMYDALPFNNGANKLVMNLVVGGVKTRISFVEEYLGKDFVIISNDISYNGVFQNTQNFIAL